MAVIDADNYDEDYVIAQPLDELIAAHRAHIDALAGLAADVLDRTIHDDFWLLRCGSITRARRPVDRHLGEWQ